MTDTSEPNATPGDTAVENSLPEAVTQAPAADAPDAGQSEEQKGGGLGKSLLVGTAVGIGSAAIVAALLYTKRNKK